MLKVLHVNDYPPGSGGGGAEVVLAATMDLLRARGVELDTFTAADLPDHRFTPVRYVSNSIARRALRRMLLDFRPDVVHLHNFYHVLSPSILVELARWKRKKTSRRVVMTAHDYHLVCPNSGGSWFRGDGRMRVIDPHRLHSLSYLTTRRWDHRTLAHSTLKLAQHLWHYRACDRRRVIDLVLCPSRFIQRLIRNVHLPTMHLPHPAPRAASAGARLEPAAGPLHAVFAGRVEPEKGLATFLHMMPIDFGGRITVIGDGSELERCRRTCAARGLSNRVEFLGRLPHEQTLAVIARAHLLVLPSLCLENYPLSVIEALATGANVLVSDLGGMKEIVETTGVGYTFAPGDRASLARALGRIEADFQRGALNAFDLSTLRTQRGEAAHLRALMRAYGASEDGSMPGRGS